MNRNRLKPGWQPLTRRIVETMRLAPLAPSRSHRTVQMV